MANSTDFLTIQLALRPRSFVLVAPQTRVLALNSNNQPSYIAVGPRGAATSDASWIVEKLIYDGNGFYSYSQHSVNDQIADNYLTLTYA